MALSSRLAIVTNNTSERVPPQIDVQIIRNFNLDIYFYQFEVFPFYPIQIYDKVVRILDPFWLSEMVDACRTQSIFQFISNSGINTVPQMDKLMT